MATCPGVPWILTLMAILAIGRFICNHSTIGLGLRHARPLPSGNTLVFNSRRHGPGPAAPDEKGKEAAQDPYRGAGKMEYGPAGAKERTGQTCESTSAAGR